MCTYIYILIVIEHLELVTIDCSQSSDIVVLFLLPASGGRQWHTAGQMFPKRGQDPPCCAHQDAHHKGHRGHAVCAWRTRHRQGRQACIIFHHVCTCSLYICISF